MTPPKNYTYTTLLSHMDNVTFFYIFTLFYLISTPPKTILEYFKAWPFPSWDGLGLFGLWPSWAWAWALGLGLIFILCLLLIFRRLEERTSNVRVDVLFLH